MTVTFKVTIQFLIIYAYGNKMAMIVLTLF
jgi:hypothetical protein